MENTNNKISRSQHNIYDTDKTVKILSVGEVISVTDPNYLGRIKVRIKGTRAKGGDDGILDADLPWCFPLIPKFISSQPKVKESVFVFTFGTDKQFIDRMYIGPIISQPQQLSFDPYYMSALSSFSFDSAAPNTSVATIPQLKGVFPNPEDVSIQGRYNTEITQKNNEIVLKAGKFIETPTNNIVINNNPFPFTYNTKTMGYIQIKNDVTISTDNNNNVSKGTVANIVASKVNILTHENGNPNFNLTNPDDLISEEELARILSEGHQLPFGDILLQYLILVKNAVLNHVHNGSGNVATDLTTNGVQSIKEFKEKANALEAQMLSKNIRIN